MLSHTSIFKHILISVVGFGAAVTIGCSSSASDSQYEALITDYGNQLDQMNTMNDEHTAAVTASTDLASVQAEEDTHYADMTVLMDQMMTTTASIESCGMMDDMDMTGMVDMMMSMMESHQTNMAAAADLTAAQQEETEHAAAMESMMQDMEDDYDAMYGMIGMDGMSC